jgi:hypothetical protein
LYEIATSSKCCSSCSRQVVDHPGESATTEAQPAAAAADPFALDEATMIQIQQLVPRMQEELALTNDPGLVLKPLSARGNTSSSQGNFDDFMPKEWTAR